MKSVSRQSATVAADSPLDPLSMFAMETQSVRSSSPVEDYVLPVGRPVSARVTAVPASPAPPAAPPAHVIGASKAFSGGSSAKLKRSDELKDQLVSLSSSLSSAVSNLSSNLGGASLYSSAFSGSSSSSSSAAAVTPARSSASVSESLSRAVPATETNSNTAAPLNSSQLSQQQEAADSFQYLSGERKVMSIPHCSLQIFAFGNVTGLLYITTYRLSFLVSAADLEPIARSNPNIYSYVQVPLGCIDKVEREKRGKESLSTTASMTLLVHCKDCRVLRIHIRGSSNSLNSEYELDKVFNVLCAYAFPNNLRHVFAFTHTLPVPKEGTDLLSEYARMGVLEMSGLRLSQTNRNFRLCSTYPETLVVPATVSDEELFTVAAFRAGHRLPALTWVNRDNGATLWRCSQPKSGVSGSSPQDERMLDCIARLAGNPAFLHKRYSQDIVLNIVDCRSKASAMANRAAGAGYESQANYPSSRIDFFNIPNIHGVRDSFKSLLAIVSNPTANPSSDISFSKQVDDTNWITNLRLILKASWDTAAMLRSGQPVLVHCSHGWDRTAQVCALAQLLLDPYYRTMDGFAALVEKDWNSFGHTFYARCAQSQDKATRAEDEVSQIFIQFLDCVWQIQKQFPYYFEFNARYIVAIADHVYSCRFGTFLCSSDADRQNYNVKQETSDLWTYLKYNKETFVNQYFSEKNTILLPPLGQLLRGVSLWADYFLRYSTVHSLPSIPAHLAKFMAYNEKQENVDLAVPPLSTTIDYYEAIIRKERTAKQDMEEQLKAADLNIKALVLEMEEIIQGKLTEGEFSKFQALKTRCLEQVSIAETHISSHHELAAASSEDQGCEEETSSVKAPLTPQNNSLKIPKMRMDSVSEADYVLPKIDNSSITSEFFV